MASITDAQALYLDQKEAYLDQFIDHNDDYQLFISSYIHGHFSVVAAKLASTVAQVSPSEHEQADSDWFSHAFEQQLRQDIESAIANNELSVKDAQAVKRMLSAMFNAH
jgi:hypothetical protein